MNKTRDELRSAKNVNRRLEKLKEQIKAEKLQKRLAKLDATQSAKVLEHEALKRKHVQIDDEDEGDDVLVIKDKNDNAFEDEGELPTFDLDQVTQSRKKKKMRIDGSSTGLNKKTIFDDDGEEISEQHIFTPDEAREHP